MSDEVKGTVVNSASTGGSTLMQTVLFVGDTLPPASQADLLKMVQEFLALNLPVKTNILKLYVSASDGLSALDAKAQVDRRVVVLQDAMKQTGLDAARYAVGRDD